MKIIAILLGILSIIFTAGILLPSPNMRLFPLTVGAPEFASWLVILNAFAALLALAFFRPVVPIFLVSLLVALWPLLSIPRVVSSMTKQHLHAQIHPLDILLRSPSVPRIEPQLLPNRTLFYRAALNKSNDQRGPLPILIDLYSGAWRGGEPKDDEQFSRYMADRGYAVFAIDYRHAPAARYPAQIDDVRATISWIVKNAAQYGGDAGRIALCGRSAGAQLAMLAAYTSQYQPDAPRISAVISFYGPTDLARGHAEPPVPDPIGVKPVSENYIGGTPAEFPEAYREASPINYVRAHQTKLPPTLLIHGSRDHIVKVEFARELHRRLLESGNRSYMLELPWAEHAFDAIFSGLGNQLALAYVEAFLKQTL